MSIFEVLPPKPCTTNTTHYDGEYLVDVEDVVVVALSCRLDIFGFSGAPGLTPNVDWLDQRLAVERVRDNMPIVHP
jgi:cholinesterase